MTTPYTVDSGWTRLSDPTTLARVHDQTADGFFCDDPSIHRHLCRRCWRPIGRHEPITVDMWTGWQDGHYPTAIYGHLNTCSVLVGPKDSTDLTFKWGHHLTDTEYAQRWNLSIAHNRNIDPTHHNTWTREGAGSLH